MDLRCTKRLQCLPQAALENIFGFLHLREVSHLGRECVSFRNAAKSVLAASVRRLISSVDRQTAWLEVSSHQVNDWDPTVSAKYLHIALLHTVLKVCQSELNVIQACCWRYMRDPTVNFCFPAGDLIDEIYFVLSLVKDREVNKELEPEITTHLFLRTEKFLDLFDMVLEPGLASRGYGSPAGLKIMDILDCCQTSNYEVRLTHAPDSSEYTLDGAYELRDIGTIDKPPGMDPGQSMGLKLQTVTRFLRNHVRWNNLFNLLKELWDLEDSVEKHKKSDTKPMSPLSPVYRSHCRMQFQSQSESARRADQPCEDVFYRNILHIGTRIGVECRLVVRASELPLCLEWLEGNHIKASPSEGGFICTGVETEGTYSSTGTLDSAVQTDMCFPVRGGEGSTRVAAGITRAMEKKQGKSSFSGANPGSLESKPECYSLSEGSSFEMELKVQTPSNDVPPEIVESVIAVHQSEHDVSVTSNEDGLLMCAD